MFSSLLPGLSAVGWRNANRLERQQGVVCYEVVQRGSLDGGIHLGSESDLHQPNADVQCGGLLLSQPQAHLRRVGNRHPGEERKLVSSFGDLRDSENDIFA